MLRITIPGHEVFNEETNTFSRTQTVTLELEHSLFSLSKWESQWEKPFMSKDEKTTFQLVDYIRAMTLTKDVDPEVYTRLSTENFSEINDYISAQMTATTFAETPNKPSREVITAEVIYYWMVALSIPFECQYWHLNRLLTLVRVTNIKNAPPKKAGKPTVGSLANRSKLNAQRRAQSGSRG